MDEEGFGIIFSPDLILRIFELLNSYLKNLTLDNLSIGILRDKIIFTDNMNNKPMFRFYNGIDLLINNLINFD